MPLNFKSLAALFAATLLTSSAHADYDVLGGTAEFLGDSYDAVIAVPEWIGDTVFSESDLFASAPACCPDEEPAPLMLGDAGLMQPRLIAGTNSVRMMHRHYSRFSNNNSALPQDRVSFEYRMLQDTVTLAGIPGLTQRQDANLDEFAVRLEKTFLEGNASISVILPWYHTVGYDVAPNAFNSQAFPEATQLGDITFDLKGLLYQDESLALSAGVTVQLPTSNDLVYFGAFKEENDEWWFTPYVAALYRNDGLFVQTFAGVQLPSDGQSVVFGNALILQHRMPPMFMLDAAAGYRIYENRSGAGFLKSLTPSIELHYTSTFKPETPPILITAAAYGVTDTLNLTLALNAVLTNDVSVTAGLNVPLRETQTFNAGRAVATEQMYDWAFMLNINYFFGG